ncbi:protein MIZU-KUSSEI 1-like [Zingiber officinale]|nr:protein MIZU-KUSSEI 1-like [Zingiber officinale]
MAAAFATAVPSHPGPSSVADQDEHPKQPMLHHLSPSPQVSLVAPSSHYRRRRPARVVRVFRSICRTLPIFTPKCKISVGAATTVACSAVASPLSGTDSRRNSLVTGTLFGCRKGRVSFSIQENPRCLPSLVVELSLLTHVLLREMSTGMVRIALECEKNSGNAANDGKAASLSSRALLEEPLWTLFCNGKRNGYGVRREPTEDDLGVMETLRVVSMGAGVLPARAEGEEEVAYLRAGFDHIIASRDAETLYMTSPDDGPGPDLTIFFVRM